MPLCARYEASQTEVCLVPFQTIKPDFSNFDESAAWPHLLDDFVEYMNKKRGKK